MRTEGVEIGGSVNRSSSDSTRFRAASLNVGGNLSIHTGRDLSLLGARIDVAGDARVNVGRDLTIQTLQDLSESDNFSAGLTVTIGPSGPTAAQLISALGQVKVSVVRTASHH